MSRRAIWEALKAEGIVVNGADPVKALGTMLWRSGGDKLIQLDKHGYWPINADYEPADYYGSLV